MLKRLGTISGLTLVSRIAGLARDLMLAAVLGAGPLADAFMLAFRLPNHFRAVFAEGAFNAAFLPTYAATRTQDGESAANALASTVLVWLTAVNLLLLAGVMAAPGLTLDLLAPGVDTNEAALTLHLMRITFPYLLCMSLVAFFSALLNAHDRFAAAAAAPILLNLFMIGGLGVAHLFPTAAHAAAWSVFAAGIAQVTLLIMAARSAGISLLPGVPRVTPATRLFLRRLGPAILTSGAVQVAVFADTILATFLPAGSLSHLYYADRIYQLPVGVIGIAVGTLLLPDIARRAGAGDDSGMLRSASRALRLCVDLAAPLTVVMIVLGDWIMAVLFVRGAFDMATAQASALILAAYSLGLVPGLSVRALVSCFQGRGDLRTPFRALAIATVVNIALKLSLVGYLGAAGLALATSAGLWIYVGTLFVLARSRGFVDLRIGDILISAFPSLFCGAALYALRDPLLAWCTAVAGGWGMMLALVVGGLSAMVFVLATRLALGKAFG
ncbi:murein biosynthesis integral membrane protein MurJ [Puniceibacterium sediminis]|uniref:Probable lipid II flippase MurJ n=1 Tax=Puniceibacterium sediminis TaxID=1608407 RepID=A0A238WXL7_9RHOB|nr:murein biosynthesis integral membrane protein MurJ [Puniceibacterium sediminis]SNR50954.1 putative peptidoglycan lipid II flippase [Puniceibacterium sediminis]